MEFLKLRNDELDPRYDSIATHYMRIGEELGVRWDIAFYQMVVETGALSYWRGHRAGDVKPEQNNFAGLGATGNGVRGESFRDIETGVRGHLEHIRLYAGRPVANPVAERTRKVHEWRILDKWRGSFRRPITYTDLAVKWAPGTRGYASTIKAVADHFHSALCGARDPRPELLREARAGTAAAAAPVAQAPAADAAPPVSGQELAQRAIAQAREEGTDRRSGLGAQAAAPARLPAAAATAVPYKVTDERAPAADAARAAVAGKAAAVDKPAAAGAPRYALAGTASGAAGRAKSAITDTAAPPAANQRCRVWTASYGGQKSVIIRSVADQVVNFTVLDVNDGAETREAEAFINAYAKNGKITGEYPSQAQALDRAFELCPEG